MEILAGYVNVFFLLAGVLVLSVRRIWSDESAKGYIAVAKLFIVADLLSLIFFYDKNIWPEYMSNDAFSLAVYILTALMMYVWLSLSLKWFTASGLPSCWFCVLALLLLFCFKILVATVNLGIMAAILTAILLLQYMLLRFSQENEEFHNISGKYLINTALCIVLLGVSLYLFAPENWSLANAFAFIQTLPMPQIFITIGGLLVVLLFMMGIAPLHFGITDIVGPAVLPVAAYFTFVPIMALWTTFIKLNVKVFASLSTRLESFYVCLGIICIIIGAIGANSSRNLRRIFAFMALFNLGILLMVIAPFNYQSVVYVVCGLLFYVLTCLGVYTVFYGFKSQGEYLSTLNTLYGFFKVRPFMALTLFFFLLSVTNVAPLWGFLNLWELLHRIVADKNYLLMIVVFGTALLLLSALFQVSRTIFFTKKSTNFDRGEFSVYLFLALNLLLQMWLMLNAGALSETVNNLLSEMVS